MKYLYLFCSAMLLGGIYYIMPEYLILSVVIWLVVSLLVVLLAPTNNEKNVNPTRGVNSTPSLSSSSLIIARSTNSLAAHELCETFCNRVGAKAINNVGRFNGELDGLMQRVRGEFPSGPLVTVDECNYILDNSESIVVLEAHKEFKPWDTTQYHKFRGSWYYFNQNSIVSLRDGTLHQKHVTQISGTNVFVASSNETQARKLLMQEMLEDKNRQYVVIEAQSDSVKDRKAVANTMHILREFKSQEPVEEKHTFQDDKSVNYYSVNTQTQDNVSAIYIKGKNADQRDNHDDNLVASNTKDNHALSFDKIRHVISKAIAIGEGNLNKRVIFKCQEGKDRSVTLAAIYLMVMYCKNKGMNGITVSDFKKICAIIFLDVGPVVDFNPFINWGSVNKRANVVAFWDNPGKLCDMINEQIISPLLQDLLNVERDRWRCKQKEQNSSLFL